MVFGVTSYLKFLWKSSNEHGVHSPFVFNLITNCFYDEKKYPEYKCIATYRTNLFKNPNSITVTDFGAGSRIFKSDKRKISDIAKTAGISVKRANALFRVTQYLQPNAILEIGTSLGIATSALALGNKSSQITSLEGCSQTATVAQIQLQQLSISNVNVICTQFYEYLQKIKAEKFDLIYFDGNHTEEATLAYFVALLPTITNDTCWIFDDIYWSKGMKRAWNQIKSHELVTVTIDTFQWGFVFFRKEQEKEHFTVRL